MEFRRVLFRSQEFSCRLGEGPAARDLRGSIGPLTDENGDNSLFLLTLIDRTQEMMIERNLCRELVSDSLTGLPNRAGFEELVEMSVEGEELAEHAILLLDLRSEEHTSELQSLMRISYAVFCLQKQKQHERQNQQL